MSVIKIQMREELERSNAELLTLVQDLRDGLRREPTITEANVALCARADALLKEKS